MKPQQPVRPPPKPPAPRRRGGGWVVFLIVIVIGGAVGAWLYFRSPAAEASAKESAAHATHTIPVVTAVAKKADVPVYIDGLGTVTALNTVTLRSRVDGQLVKVNYDEGQIVKQGETLVEIDPQPYQVQLEQAEGQLAKDQSLLDNAKLDLERYQDAAEAVSKQQLDTAKSLVAQYQGSLKTDQAAIDSAKLQLQYAHITSPITGRIGLRLVDVGNMVHSTDTTGLAVITQIQPISVVFSLPEDSLQRILKAMKGTGSLAVEAYDRDMKSKLATGKLTAVDSQIDSTTATAKFKAEFANEDESLYPNQFVNVRLLVETLKEATTVPAAALQRSPDGIYVYVVKDDQTVENRTVTIGQSEGERTQILTGINEGETVVIDGVDKLKPGMAVTARKPGQSSSTQPTGAQHSNSGGQGKHHRQDSNS